MPSIITCPACAGQLRLPDEAIGQSVCCPECSNVFTAAATPSSHPSASAPRHESAPPSPDNGHTPEAAGTPRGLVGAVELKPSPNDQGAGRVPARAAEPEKDTRPCPVCGKPVARAARRCYECDTPLFPTDGSGRSWERNDREVERSVVREPERRDRVPSRGVMVLVLGIISLLCMTPVFVSPLGIILGIIAWLMGHGDLNRMAAHEMDPDGGLTKGGWICGMIGTVVNTLITLACLGGMSVLLLENANRAATSYDQPVQYRDDVKDDGQGKNKGVKKQLPPVPPPPKKQ